MLRTTKKEHKLQTKKPPCSMHSKFHNETRMLFRTRSNTSFSVWRGFRRNPPAHLRTASCHHINRLHHIPDRLHHIPDRLHHIPDRRPRVSCFSDLGSLGQVGFSFDLDQPNSSLYRFLVISKNKKSHSFGNQNVTETIAGAQQFRTAVQRQTPGNLQTIKNRRTYSRKGGRTYVKKNRCRMCRSAHRFEAPSCQTKAEMVNFKIGHQLQINVER